MPECRAKVAATLLSLGSDLSSGAAGGQLWRQRLPVYQIDCCGLLSARVLATSEGAVTAGPTYPSMATQYQRSNRTRLERPMRSIIVRRTREPSASSKLSGVPGVNG